MIAVEAAADAVRIAVAAGYCDDDDAAADTVDWQMMRQSDPGYWPAGKERTGRWQQLLPKPNIRTGRRGDDA